MAGANSASNSLDSSLDGLTLFKFVSLGIIIALGSAGNVLVMYAFSRNFHLRRSPYVLMLGFVSLDLIRVFICFPVIFVTVMNKLQWKYGRELCQLMAFTNVFCLFGNSLTVLAMAIDRYVATRYKHFHHRKLRGFIGTAILLVVWGLAFLFAFPAVYGLGSYQYLPVEAQCTFPHHYYKNDMDTLGLLLSLTTVIIFTQFVYFKLFVFLRGRRRMRPVQYEPAMSEDWSFFRPAIAANQNQWLASSLPTSATSTAPVSTVGRMMALQLGSLQIERPKRDENVTKTCFVVNIVYTLMWLPYIVVCFWYALQYHSKASGVPDWLEVTATWLTYLQVTLTPVAFFSVAGFTRKSLLRKRTRNYPNDHVAS